MDDEYDQCIYCSSGNNCNLDLPGHSHAAAMKSISLLIGAIIVATKIIW